MKKRLQGIVIGFLLSIVVVNTAVYATTGESMAKTTYNNIKIHVDGKEIVPKDGNGGVVEPFIMNGTTYLPVRAVADAFGKDVIWDGATQSIYLGKKDQNQPDNYLDRIQYSDFYAGGEWGGSLSIIDSKVTDFRGTDYTNGLLLRPSNSPLKGDDDRSNLRISYPLNREYKKLTGNIVIPDYIRGGQSNSKNNVVTVYFYGDGRLLHTVNYVTTSMPFKFDFDVSGVNSLEIKIKTESRVTGYVALTNLALYK